MMQARAGYCRRSALRNATARSKSRFKSRRLESDVYKTRGLQSPRRLFCILATIECGNANVAFTLSAESAAGRDHNIQFVQHVIEHRPAGHAICCSNPNVGSIGSTEHL